MLWHAIANARAMPFPQMKVGMEIAFHNMYQSYF
jgi:hypothetical protein